MIGDDIDIFLSCSFASDDIAIIELIRSVCVGMGLQCINVDAGSSSVPPEKAKEYISRASGLVAVATRRDLLNSGEFIMPSAVREEISIAYGLGKRILIIGEEGVRFDGFMSNYGTRLPFSREVLTQPTFIQKLVFSVYTFRREVAATDNTPHVAGEYFSENTRRLVSLNYDGTNYKWVVSTTKLLHFEHVLERDINTSVWPRIQPQLPPEAPLPKWSVDINASSRPFEVKPAIRHIAPDRIDLALRFHPDPQPGDYIDFTRTFESQYLNPLFADDLPPGSPPAVIIDGRNYLVSDGIVLAELTKKLHSNYRFPAVYGLQANDIGLFVASHSFHIGYLAPWELKRFLTNVESFGTELVVDFSVENPMPYHIYGIAWSPPRQMHSTPT